MRDKEIEMLVEIARELLLSGPATLEEVSQEIEHQTESDNRPGIDSLGAAGIAIGTLMSQGEVRADSVDTYMLSGYRSYSEPWPMWYVAVRNTLLDEGPGPFGEVMERIRASDAGQVGLALGWLYGKEKAMIVGRRTPRQYWCAVPRYVRDLLG